MRETLKRTLRTFAQAAAGYIVANLALLPAAWEDRNVVKTALTGFAVSAIAAGLAAVMNLPEKAEGGKN